MLAVVTALVMAVGLVGVVFPFVPGLTIIWLAALAYGVIGEFGTAGAVAFGIITVFFIVGESLGLLLPGRAAGRAGAPAGSIGIGALCAAVGFFVIPVFGFVLGGIGGIFLAEYVRTNSTNRAWDTTMSTLVGFGVSVLAQLVFGVGMIVTWAIWHFLL